MLVLVSWLGYKLETIRSINHETIGFNRVESEIFQRTRYSGIGSLHKTRVHIHCTYQILRSHILAVECKVECVDLPNSSLVYFGIGQTGHRVDREPSHVYQPIIIALENILCVQ